MATKKKSKKKTKSKKTAGKRLTSKKKLAKKKASPKQAALKTTKAKAGAKKKAGRKSPAISAKRIREKTYSVDAVAFEPAGRAARAAGQAGDLEGLSDVAGADSESVDELIEEGNAFEAAVVKGVEDAPDPDQGEVRTHEVPEDDVPEEYDEK